MMKRVALILFCLFYTLSSSGMVLKAHYCHGTLKSISFTHSDESKCCGKKKMKSKNCCKEKSFVYKVNNNQDASGKYFSFKTFTNFSDLFNNSALISLEQSKTNLFLLPDFHAPPDIGSKSTYLLNGVFRI